MIIKFSINFETNDFIKLFKKYKYEITVGNIFSGKVLAFEKSLCLVDIGAAVLSVLPIGEISVFQSFQVHEIFNINNINEFLLLKYSPNKNIAILSLKRFKSIIIWKRLKTLIKENLIVSGHLEKSTKHGKIVRLSEFKAFIENSHLPKYYRRKKLRKLNVPLKFLRLNQTKNRIFLSCKLAHFKNQSKFLKIGQYIYGCVTQIKSYGLFINIYGLKGLLHISEISTKRIDDLNTIFKKGQLIIVKILFININRGRISLSLKFSQ